MTGLSGRVTFSAQTISHSVKPLGNRGWKASHTMGGLGLQAAIEACS